MWKHLLAGLLLAGLAGSATAQPRCYLAVDDPPPEASPSPIMGVPTGGRLQIGDEGFGLGSRTPDPTALEGYSRQDVVLFDSNRISTIAITAGYLARLSEADHMLLEVEADQATGVADLSFAHYPVDWPGRLTIQAFGTTARSPVFDGGRTPDPLMPYVHRLGGGVEWAQAAGEDLDLAIALNYQQVGVGKDLLGGRLTPTDARGYPLTLDPSGQDFIAAVRLVGLYEGQNDLNFPTEGTKLRFEMQAGSTRGAFSRMAFNWAQLFPLGEESCALLNLQAGTLLGTFIPYQAFNLGGVNSVRGYSTGELGTTRSFFQSTVELRHILTHFELFDYDVGLRGVLFADWATDLGTAGSVPGQPAITRGKPLQGMGYGFGFHFLSEFGVFRLETGWTGQGQNSVYLTVGERF